MSQNKVFIFLYTISAIVAILIFLMMLTYDLKQKEIKQKNYAEKNKVEVTNYPKVEIEVRK